MTNLNQDINLLINKTYTDSAIYLRTPNYGFKAVVVRYFELLRYLGLSYYHNSNQDFLNTPEFLEVDSILKNIIRNWYDNLLNNLMTSFSNFIDQTNLINVSTFIVLIVFIIVIYIIVWKGFEENLKELFKTSVDLINLIPDSFKNMIVLKLNEEDDENKKE